ncbi:MAG TPA: DUF86 domain-containing protein [Candidatus Methylomirabilis sp.]|nr:DUF86 domain-containing protein [Candidatus Methylomirabilis sp.]
MWRDEAWLLDMLGACRKAISYAQGLEEARFIVSGLHQDAIIRQLTILGEATKQVSPEFRTAHPDIPWRRIAGFRDIAVHGYFRLDLNRVWRIVREDLPQLAAALEPLVPPEDQVS